MCVLECPFQDVEWGMFADRRKCQDMNPYICASYSYVRLYCCNTCKAYETPWLGPNCTHGDLSNWCAYISLDAGDCDLWQDMCCNTCCPTTELSDGYSCDRVNLTTTLRPTTSVSTTSIKSTLPTKSPGAIKEMIDALQFTGERISIYPTNISQLTH